MSYERLPYEDAAPTAEMVSDCAAVGRALRLSLEHGELPSGVPFERTHVDEIVVPDSLADLAREMQLHLG